MKQDLKSLVVEAMGISGGSCWGDCVQVVRRAPVSGGALSFGGSPLRMLFGLSLPARACILLSPGQYRSSSSKESKAINHEVGPVWSLAFWLPVTSVWCVLVSGETEGTLVAGKARAGNGELPGSRCVKSIWAPCGCQRALDTGELVLSDPS